MRARPPKAAHSRPRLWSLSLVTWQARQLKLTLIEDEDGQEMGDLVAAGFESVEEGGVVMYAQIVSPVSNTISGLSSIKRGRTRRRLRFGEAWCRSSSAVAARSPMIAVANFLFFLFQLDRLYCLQSMFTFSLLCWRNGECKPLPLLIVRRPPTPGSAPDFYENGGFIWRLRGESRYTRHTDES